MSETDKLAVLKTLSEAQLAFILKSDEEAQTIWSKIIQANRDREKCSLEQASKTASIEYPHLYQALRGVERLQAKHTLLRNEKKFEAIWQAIKRNSKCSTEEAMRKAIELFPEFDS